MHVEIWQKYSNKHNNKSGLNTLRPDPNDRHFIDYLFIVSANFDAI